MQKVKFNRTVSFGGQMYLRGSEALLDDEQLNQLQSYYEPVKLKNAPRRVDIVPRNTAMQSPKERVSKSQLTEMSWNELRAFAREKGVAVNQKRVEIEAQLLK